MWLATSVFVLVSALLPSVVRAQTNSGQPYSIEGSVLSIVSINFAAAGNLGEWYLQSVTAGSPVLVRPNSKTQAGEFLVLRSGQDVNTYIIRWVKSGCSRG
ncbi:hypothetical protein BDV98DRAFT_595821 [Pterulicium gracile]|uniref:Uncharacterized protein n=1 Tax=Pterulicium gracile TaxID=1884261 RepID=A0A5C3QDS7_9AGAR|nr:hypothetical protein BDV98DRAFT_595821 [Pterula gracilis]